jgi:hypothetical protein
MGGWHRWDSSNDRFITDIMNFIPSCVALLSARVHAKISASATSHPSNASPQGQPALPSAADRPGRLNQLTGQRGNPQVDLGPRPDRSRRLLAAPPSLAPTQACGGTAETGHADQLFGLPFFQPGTRPACHSGDRTPGCCGPGPLPQRTRRWCRRRGRHQRLRVRQATRTCARHQFLQGLCTV